MKDYRKKILIVENEPLLRKILYTRLTILGYNVYLASDGKEALFLFYRDTPNLVILEMRLPKLDGYDVCSKIRKVSQTPIIILTTLRDVSENIINSKTGINNFLVKPFSVKDLEMRIDLSLQNFKQSHPKIKKNQTIFHLGVFIVNINKKQVLKKNTELKLTTIQFNLFELFIENAGKILSRSAILNNIWGYTPERSVDTRIIDVHVSRLRSKIEKDPTNPDFILTVRGVGYTFQPGAGH